MTRFKCINVDYTLNIIAFQVQSLKKSEHFLKGHHISDECMMPKRRKYSQRNDGRRGNVYLCCSVSSRPDKQRNKHTKKHVHKFAFHYFCYFPFHLSLFCQVSCFACFAFQSHLLRILTGFHLQSFQFLVKDEISKLPESPGPTNRQVDQRTQEQWKHHPVVLCVRNTVSALLVLSDATIFLCI